MCRVRQIRLIVSVLIVAAATFLSATAGTFSAEGDLTIGFPESAGREQGKKVTNTYVDLVGRLIYGPCRAVAVGGEKICFGNGYSMEVFLADGSLHYSRTGTVVLPGVPQYAEVSGDHVYLSFAATHHTGYDGLCVIDVSDPYHPATVGSWTAGDDVNGLALRGDYLYAAATGEGKLYVIDVSDPTNPAPVSFVDTSGDPYHVTLSGDYAFIAAVGDPHLNIVDITDPLNPVLVGENSAASNLIDVAAAGDYAFVTTSTYAFELFDVSDPSDPDHLGIQLPIMTGTSIEVNGPYAYVTNCMTKEPPSGLAIYDISDPLASYLVQPYGIPGCPAHLVIRDNTAFIANAEMGVNILDLSDPLAPVEVWRQVTGCRSENIAVSGSHAFVADGLAGLKVIDAFDHTDPVLRGGYFTGEYVKDIAISGDYAYLVNYEGLRVVDISDPGDLAEAGFIETPGEAQGIAVSGTYAYVADGNSGLRIINVGDPNNPAEAGYYDQHGCHYLSVGGNFAYIMDDYIDQLRIIDVSDISNPHEVGSYAYSYLSGGIHAGGSYVYVTFASLGPAGLSVIDVTDPTNPVEAGRLEWEGYPRQGITAYGGLAYVTDDWYGLRIVNVSDPTDPVMVGGHVTDDIASSVSLSSNGCIFVVDQYGGLYIFESQIVAALLQNFDATFGGGSVIVSWELSEPLAASDFGIERRSLPAGPYIPIGDPEIRQEGVRYTFRDSECEPGTTYRYRVEINDGGGKQVLFETDPVSTPPVSLTLYQNYPNPFNPLTVIRFHLPYREHVTLDVHDVQGRLISRLVDGVRESGPHAVTWNGVNEYGEPVSSGIYFYCLTAGKESISRKMILLR